MKERSLEHSFVPLRPARQEEERYKNGGVRARRGGSSPSVRRTGAALQ